MSKQEFDNLLERSWFDKPTPKCMLRSQGDIGEDILKLFNFMGKLFGTGDW